MEPVNLIIGSTSSLLFCICAIPQILKLVKTKETEGISLVSCWIAVFAYVLGIVYIIKSLNKDVVMLWLYIYGLFTTIIIVGLIIKYRFRNKKEILIWLRR